MFLLLLIDLKVPLSPLINLRESLLLLVNLLNTLAKKKPYYIIVPTKKANPNKKINGNVKEQNIITEKRIKK